MKRNTHLTLNVSLRYLVNIYYSGLKNRCQRLESTKDTRSRRNMGKVYHYYNVTQLFSVFVFKGFIEQSVIYTFRLREPYHSCPSFTMFENIPASTSSSNSPLCCSAGISCNSRATPNQCYCGSVSSEELDPYRSESDFN